MRRFNLYLTDAQIKQLRELRKQTGLSVAALIRQAILKLVDEKKTR